MKIQWIAESQSPYQAAQSTYEHDFECLDDTGLLIGRVIGVHIFGAETVTAFRAAREGPVVWQDLTFVERTQNGLYCTEIWYLANTVAGTYTFEPTFSASVDSILGASSYLYFGGVGAHGGATGTGDPASKAITTTQSYSRVLSVLTCETLSGITNAVNQNARWERSGASITGMGADKEVDTPASATLQFDGITVGHVWAQSSVELLSYQDNPPGIMGSGM